MRRPVFFPVSSPLFRHSGVKMKFYKFSDCSWKQGLTPCEHLSTRLSRRLPSAYPANRCCQLYATDGLFCKSQGAMCGILSLHCLVGLIFFQDDVHRFSAFFQVFKRSLRVALRPDVAEHLRSLFSVFLEAFNRRSDLKSTDEDDVSSVLYNLSLKLILS